MSTQDDAWEVIHDADEAHRLLLASDRAAAGDGDPPPRRPETTLALVQAGAVRGLRRAGRLVVSVTLSERPTFVPGPECADVAPVVYMSRLSVDPEAGDPLLGVRAVRLAVARARDDGYAALRSEVNPEVPGVTRMLTSLGFRQRGAVDRTGRFPTAQMERLLGSPDDAAR